MKPPLSKEILFIYFSGQATVLQKQLIAEWLEDPRHVEAYFEWLQEWENTSPQFLPDVENAFEKIQGMLESEARSPETDTRTAVETRHWTGWWRWAAAVLLVTGFATYFYRDLVFYRQYRTGYAQNRNLLLPDGSTVALHPNTGLKMLRWGFGWFNREVFLDGEAGFVVTHQIDHQPFTVHTPDQGKVTVLGTEFFVYSRERGTQVVLSKGKVQVSLPSMTAPMEMKPGEKASIRTSGIIDIEPLTPVERTNPVVWQEHRFRFDHTSLLDAARELHAVFGLQIVVDDPQLAAREVTGTFKARQADELLTVLSEMLDMTVQIRNDAVYLLPDSTDTN